MDELNQRIAALEAEKKKEEELRNYMQLERVCCSALQCQSLSRAAILDMAWGVAHVCTQDHCAGTVPVRKHCAISSHINRACVA